MKLSCERYNAIKLAIVTYCDSKRRHCILDVFEYPVIVSNGKSDEYWSPEYCSTELKGLGQLDKNGGPQSRSPLFLWTWAQRADLLLLQSVQHLTPSVHLILQYSCSIRLIKCTHSVGTLIRTLAAVFLCLGVLA